MATITFTATNQATGEVATRSSGTMPYTHAVFGTGVTWHKSMASAFKAATSRQHDSSGTVVPAVPTAINGKLGDWTPEVDGWGEIPAEAFAELATVKRGNTKVAAEFVAHVEQVQGGAQAPAELVFKSHKGGEWRAVAADGLVYRVRKMDTDVFSTERKGEWGWEAIGGGSTRAEAELVASTIHTAPEPITEAPAAYPGETEFDRLAHDREVRERKARMSATVTKTAPATEVDVATMVLVRVEGKPQARLDTTSGTLVWRNSSKGRAARAAGLWT
jgi:hypothetical protein